MKKLLLLFWLAGVAVFYGYSQTNLSLIDSTGAVANNSTRTISGSPSSLSLDTYMFIKNNSGAPIDVKCKKVELAAISGTENYFCWGLCFGNNVFVSPNALTIGAGDTNKFDFSGHYSPMDSVGITHMRYVFFNAANANDSVCFNVNFDTRPAGVNTLSLKKENSVRVYPNPASDRANVEYLLPAGTTAVLEIRNLLGSLVSQVALGDHAGKVTISTSEMVNGVYFYSLVENSQAVTTGKLVIRH
jgi:hypothetical protein